MIVADANLLVYFVVGGSEAAASERVYEQDEDWAVPSIWAAEVRNALLGHVRQRGMSVDEAIAAFDFAERVLLGRVVPVEAADVLRAAVRHSLSAYDAEYVVLARALGVRLVTSDKRVLAAVPEVAITPEVFAAGP